MCRKSSSWLTLLCPRKKLPSSSLLITSTTSPYHLPQRFLGQESAKISARILIEETGSSKFVSPGTAEQKKKKANRGSLAETFCSEHYDLSESFKESYHPSDIFSTGYKDYSFGLEWIAKGGDCENPCTQIFREGFLSTPCKSLRTHLA